MQQQLRQLGLFCSAASIAATTLFAQVQPLRRIPTWYFREVPHVLDNSGRHIGDLHGRLPMTVVLLHTV